MLRRLLDVLRITQSAGKFIEILLQIVCLGLLITCYRCECPFIFRMIFEISFFRFHLACCNHVE